jgi:hypothetical protein
MSTVAAASASALAEPRRARRRVSTESLRGALLWLLGFSGAFVFLEPGPYEIVGVVTIVVFMLGGLSLRPAIAPLILLLILINIGYAIAVVQVSDQTKAVVWVLISIFLAATAILYAAMLGTNTEYRLNLLLRGYLAAAVIGALVAIGAYFHAFGGASDMFMLYGRARGTFNDPNVLGTFLVLPGLLVFQRMLAGRRVIRSTVVLLIMLAALFLTFSRGAWGQFVFAAAVMMALTFVTSRSDGERLRIVLVAFVGLLVVAALLVALLSLGNVADLFKERAALEQDYDIGRYGRFGRYLLGADLALEHPFGIGPLQFYRVFVEDPHNTFLNAFMSGGWLAGFCYLTLCAVTVVRSTRYLFVRTPWQPVYHAVYATYLGIVAESAVIDIDHWRHYFLALGVLWGLMAVSRAYRAVPPGAAGAAKPLPARPVAA